MKLRESVSEVTKLYACVTFKQLVAWSDTCTSTYIHTSGGRRKTLGLVRVKHSCKHTYTHLHMHCTHIHTCRESTLLMPIYSKYMHAHAQMPRNFWYSLGIEFRLRPRLEWSVLIPAKVQVVKRNSRDCIRGYESPGRCWIYMITGMFRHTYIHTHAHIHTYTCISR